MGPFCVALVSCQKYETYELISEYTSKFHTDFINKHHALIIIDVFFSYIGIFTAQ